MDCLNIYHCLLKLKISLQIALIAGGAKEISRTISQLLKNNNKLNVLALCNVVTINRFLPKYNTYDFLDHQQLKPVGILVIHSMLNVENAWYDL